tara:strand:- start:85316 stop:85723 length:408 start_codon:yes stop_codon:yes gene_type:complete
MAGYGFFYFAAIFIPLAQTIGLFRIQWSGRNLLWLLQTPFLIYIINWNMSLSSAILLISSISMFGEALLRIIFRTTSYFLWFLLNSIGLLILYFIEEYLTFEPYWLRTLIFLISIVIYAIFSGVALEYGFIRQKK